MDIYSATSRDGGRAFVILDGKPQPPADHVEAFVFSPDSRRYAYWSTTASQWRVVVDGKLVTSPGGLASYEASLYVVEQLFGKEQAMSIA